MEGLSLGPRLFEELMRARGGFTLTGAPDREADESQGLSMVTHPYLAQNPEIAT
ncbi:MAG: hypothetical protein QXW76_00125 [Candidatus Korarchaeum sp.]